MPVGDKLLSANKLLGCGGVRESLDFIYLFIFLVRHALFLAWFLKVKIHQIYKKKQQL